MPGCVLLIVIAGAEMVVDIVSSMITKSKKYLRFWKKGALRVSKNVSYPKAPGSSDETMVTAAAAATATSTTRDMRLSKECLHSLL